MDNLYIARVLTGHMYRFSPYETCSDCGNCDGARCHTCKEKWKVEDFETENFRLFDTKEEAEEFREKVKKGEATL